MIQPNFQLSMAKDPDDLAEAQRLRYAVFVEELGGDGPLVDHLERREVDAYDAAADHLILRDLDRDPGDTVIGVYRMLTDDRAAAAGGFYSEREYDLEPLRRTGRPLLELGRSCLHQNYRGGGAMFELWSGLVEYVLENKVEIMFGTASFHGTNLDALSRPLSALHRYSLAPQELRVKARPPFGVPMDRDPEMHVDRLAAMREVPALIKAYLRLGGYVGEGAYVDHAFNTTDVCLVMDTARLNARQSAIYTRDRK
ncbi:GNAT family N-acetyltransferase [Palleronia sp. LCG004]|uniref:GNAT family N-acetyltransferase n=1 Tax=Palleronia sp. LCG004 TaxID=3079304 RepID=UPI0029421729|nr:GNAT family N-acyltransferase [Palleronia sp. LCG004]WOI56993.1 GNAT family N-acyltransferase [Palleronia sp. LCG004]